MARDSEVKDPKDDSPSTAIDDADLLDDADLDIEDGAEIVPAEISNGESSTIPQASPMAVVGSVTPSAEPSDGMKQLEIPELLPIMPIRDTVAFPGTIIPLNVGREKSKRLVEAVAAGAKVFGVVSQRSSDVEDPGIDDIYRVGTVVAILKMLQMQEGQQSVIVHGLMRFGVEEITSQEPYLIAKAHTRADTFVASVEMDALVATARQQASRVIKLTPGVPDEAQVILSNIEKPGALADFLAANITLGVVEKQELLETFDVRERLKKINAALAKQLEVLELSRKIQREVRSQIDKGQREFFLNEQLRAIQKELGQTDGRDAEIDELTKKLDAANMPPEVRKEANRELERMKRIPQGSPEYSGVADYLHWMTEIPWSISTNDELNIDRAAKILDADHYGLGKVKRRILEFLAVRKLRPTGRGPILCLAGPPGVGKTSLGKSIAHALGRKFIRMSVGGVRDEADVRGHRRTYIGSMPGRIMQEIRKAGSNNPVYMIDEVDKIGSDSRGDPSSALLEVLDPEQNSSFQDHYLGVPFDLSKVMFICTANYMEAVPPPLRDRMEVIDIPSYTRMDKLHIARKYLVPRRIEESGLSKAKVKIADDALEAIIDSYTSEAGVRNLEREIGTICRGVAALVARNKRAPKVIRPKDLQAYLGPIRYEREAALRTSVPGVATGLAWTPVGGEILFIEASAMPGKGGLTLTGQLGDVMRESVQAAYSLIRSHSKELKIDPKVLAETDFHVHIPAGAIPKDGPSAGITMYSALVSLLTNRPCKPDVAMTGEITLQGLVLPIGGLKEKAIAAHRAGIKTIIIPDRNRKDLVEIPEEVRKQIKFIPVKTADRVLAAALSDAIAAVPPPRSVARLRKPVGRKSKGTRHHPAAPPGRAARPGRHE